MVIRLLILLAPIKEDVAVLDVLETERISFLRHHVRHLQFYLLEKCLEIVQNLKPVKFIACLPLFVSSPENVNPIFIFRNIGDFSFVPKRNSDHTMMGKTWHRHRGQCDPFNEFSVIIEQTVFCFVPLNSTINHQKSTQHRGCMLFSSKRSRCTLFVLESLEVERPCVVD